MTIAVSLICGFMLGFEVIDADMIYEDDEGGTIVAVDLFIVRFLIEW